MAVQGIRPGFWKDQASKAALLPNSHVHEVPGGHVTFKYQPAEVADIMQKALVQTDQASTPL